MSSKSVKTDTDSLGSFLLSLGRTQSASYLANMAIWTLIHGLPLLIGFGIAETLKRAEFAVTDDSVWSYLAIAVGSMLIRAILIYFGLNLDFSFIFRASATIKKRIFEAVSLKSPGGIATGDLLNRIREDSDELADFLGWTADFVYRAGLLVFALIVLVEIDILATIALVPMVGGLAVGRYLKDKVSHTQTSVRKQSGTIANTIIDTLTGIRDLRLSGNVTHRISTIENALRTRRKTQSKHQMYSDLLSSLYRNMITFGSVIVLAAVSFRFASGGFTVAELILFLTYVGWIGEQIFFFGRAIANYRNANVSFDRIRPLLRVPVRQEVAELSPLASLSMDINWPHAHNQNCHLDLKLGDILVVTGENGTGKSLFIRELLQLDKPENTEVSWNGKRLDHRLPWAVAPFVGYAHQGAHFFSGTVRDNLLLANVNATDAELKRALRAVQFNQKSLPNGLDTVIGSSRAAGLSGGQRHRLAMARMLVAPAQVYVVDECDSSLDKATAMKLWQTVLHGWPGVWIIVSRNDYLIGMATKVVDLRK